MINNPRHQHGPNCAAPTSENQPNAVTKASEEQLNATAMTIKTEHNRAARTISTCERVMMTYEVTEHIVVTKRSHWHKRNRMSERMYTMAGLVAREAGTGRCAQHIQKFRILPRTDTKTFSNGDRVVEMKKGESK